MNTEREIEIKSEEVKDIISYVPNWMIRWGNILILSLVISFVLGLFVIQYPDVIHSEIIVTTAIPPAKIVTRSSGKLVELLATEGQLVEKDEVLAVIENPANYKDVLKLKNMINNFSRDSITDSATEWIQKSRLGEIEDEYSTFEKSLKEYLLQLEINPEQREGTILKWQLVEHKELYNKQLTQRKLFEEELKLASQDYERNQKLYKDKVLSVKEFEEKTKEYLQIKRNHENLKISLSNTKIALNDLRKSLALLDIKGTKTSNVLKRDLNEGLRNLNVSILNWEQKYLLVSPIKGRVSFLSPSSRNVFVKEGENMFGIVPEEGSQILGKLLMPVRNSGKVKEGQDVNICLDSYPCEEWGMLKGRVKSISLVPQNGKYLIEVEIPEGMRTTYNRELVFKQEMQGSARIVTEKRRLIERVFYQVRKLTKESR